jgi:hypothetical protein
MTSFVIKNSRRNVYLIFADKRNMIHINSYIKFVFRCYLMFTVFTSMITHYT